MRLVLLVPALLAAPLAAQSVRDRLEGRVPAEAIATIDSLVQVAAQDSLPTEPLVQKALEGGAKHVAAPRVVAAVQVGLTQLRDGRDLLVRAGDLDRKSTRLNSSHANISYAVFCLKKKKKNK